MDTGSAIAFLGFVVVLVLFKGDPSLLDAAIAYLNAAATCVR